MLTTTPPRFCSFNSLNGFAATFMFTPYTGLFPLLKWTSTMRPSAIIIAISTLLTLTTATTSQDSLKFTIHDTGALTCQLNLTAAKHGKNTFNTAPSSRSNIQPEITNLIHQATAENCDKDCCYNICYAFLWMPLMFWPCRKVPFIPMAS